MRFQFQADAALHNGSTTLIPTIQLMHSFKVNIKICQPENSDIRRAKHFRGLANSWC